ncbi:MAG TPA: NAD-dependent epimerase/dehydratase family protein [Candidatus Limnocylindrales bacterium]|nr:NAD-dependent epimerase/dehydratase family protein [Candidatus Limnocylindrales bacterium]
MATPPAPEPTAASPGAHPVATPEPAPRRRIVVTGAAGFVGSAVARRLHARGDHVVALVRDPARAGRIRELAAEGLELVADDLSDVAGLTEVLRDADAVIHAAGGYRVGIRKSERGAMWDANVGTTTRILDAAEAARTPRVVYVSTCNVFGNTRGQVVDETYRRDLADGFLSWYDETKYGAHEVAEQRIAAGAPIVIVLPSQVYGPGDQSSFGEQLRRAGEGTLRYRAVDDLGVGLVHVDDLASGIVAALDDGRVGASYVLSGPTVRLRDAISLAAAVGGRRPPRLAVPTALLRLIAPIGGLVGQPNLREALAASAGVTYWASAARAERELGWHARDLETGFRDLLGGPPTATD